ncbi:hypothetical protein COCSADRAFT_37616 [Bipolaris sorokiniana ND90Pr]|uniref:Uncharacterized protein n=1 Tax=Cochliobolus sativus (strain ND90Pr / ATCC 201652) TaxID=665912 RepID=M2T3P1_COCSN|nr:uncharacterized protein COCSADRAFT_37616 [Bipolaris sorokiniana ND90Pr]EMD63866.1 hypothetical protein COCSADRAFT_37616 [Bipolaris sorokiniana ND90Pr]
MIKKSGIFQIHPRPPIFPYPTSDTPLYSNPRSRDTPHPLPPFLVRTPPKNSSPNTHTQTLNPRPFLPPSKKSNKVTMCVQIKLNNKFALQKPEKKYDK